MSNMKRTGQTTLYERLSRDDEMQGKSDFTPFLNIMDEWYARDTSRKMRSIFRARTEEGKRSIAKRALPKKKNKNF